MLDDPAAFAKFQAAQNEMTPALSRLLVVAENYPQLKADASFRDLQAQLEGTENRIAVARNRYIEVGARVQRARCAQFPINLTAMMFGFTTKPELRGRGREGDRESRPRWTSAAGAPAPRRRSSARWLARAGSRAARRAGGAAARGRRCPSLHARVTDLTGTLDAGQRAALEARLAAFERAKGSQVVGADRARPRSPRRSSSTGSASPTRGRSAAAQDRRRRDPDRREATTARVRIEVGRGLEGVLPDAIAKRITDDDDRARASAPATTTAGVSDGVERIIGVIEGEPLPPPRSAAATLPSADALVDLIVRCRSCSADSCGSAHNRAAARWWLARSRSASAWWLIGALVTSALLIALSAPVGRARAPDAAADAAGRAEVVRAAASAAAASAEAGSAVAAVSRVAAASAAAAPRGDGDERGSPAAPPRDRPASRAPALPASALARDRGRDRRRRAAPRAGDPLRGRRLRSHPRALLRGVTPRERAIALFGELRVWDTEHNTGVLIYLLLADRDVEIVADRGVAPRASRRSSGRRSAARSRRELRARPLRSRARSRGSAR